MIPKTTNKFQIVGGRNIYNAIYDTLQFLKPINCLEIGTFHGQSARVFQEYFNVYYPNGKLVTIDIKKYVDLSDCPNIKQVIVHPHVENSSDWHFVENTELLEYTPQSVKTNIKLIHEITYGHKFDFCFLDGDHQLESVRRDFLIAQNELNDPKYILFDDIDLEAHDSSRYYQEQIKVDNNLNIYDFNNWDCWVGAALLWNKTIGDTK